MLINEASKRIIYFREQDAKVVGEGSYYMDLIVWLNGQSIELGRDVGFNYGCYVNGYGGLVIGDGTIFGPYVMIHTANHRMDDPECSVAGQGWKAERPVEIGCNVWIGMGVAVLPEVSIGDSCVIGAGSVVANALQPYTISVVNPAPPIKSRR